MMRILLLNQFMPPEQPPTARLAGDLAAALQAAGHQVSCIGASSGYGAVGGVRRVLRDVAAHLTLARRVLAAGPCDWIICLSDPTGLPLTGRLLAIAKRARLGHWAMDIYPQIAVALGALRPGALSRLVGAAMRAAYRGCDLLVTLDADMAAEIRRVSGRQAAVLPPWPPAIADPEPAQSKSGMTDGQPSSSIGKDSRRPGLRWLYSGNLGRAHEFETLLMAQQILEAEDSGWELHFQGGGPGRSCAEEMAKRLKLSRCRWSGYAPDDQLLDSLREADVLVATQKPQTRGLLWPSKLALLKHLGLPLVWVGPTEGAVVETLRGMEVPVAVIAPGQAAKLAAWLMAQSGTPHRPRISGIRAAVDQERQAGCEWWLERLGATGY